MGTFLGHAATGSFFFALGLFVFLRSLGLKKLAHLRTKDRWIAIPCTITIIGGFVYLYFEFDHTHTTKDHLQFWRICRSDVCFDCSLTKHPHATLFNVILVYTRRNSTMGTYEPNGKRCWILFGKNLIKQSEKAHLILVSTNYVFSSFCCICNSSAANSKFKYRT